MERQLSYLFSSDPAAGAQNISDNGDRFSVILNDPIRVPKEALYATLEVVNASVVYVMPNVSAQIGNNLLNFNHQGTAYNYVFPDGLYDIPTINAYLSRTFTNDSLPADLFSFSGDSSTQKAVLTFNYAGTRIDFTAPNSINTLLGFEPIFYPLINPSIVGESFTSQSTAKINRVSSFLLHCSLAPSGIPTNAVGSNIISQVPIPSNSVGKTINYSPFNPVRVNVDQLIGMPVNIVDCRISDQLDRTVDTLGEAFSFLAIIRFGIQAGETHPRSQKYQNARTYSAQ